MIIKLLILSENKLISNRFLLNRKNNIIDGRDNIIKTEDEHDQ